MIKVYSFNKQEKNQIVTKVNRIINKYFSEMLESDKGLIASYVME